MSDQLSLFDLDTYTTKQVSPFRQQLLKWIGNKQRFAHEIISYFPDNYKTYYEPFLGSGAVLGTLSPSNAVASDILKPLIELWQTLNSNPELVKQWYYTRWQQIDSGEKKEEYEKIKASFNQQHNPADLLFLSRSCYGGVIRFRKDGYMSTPCGVHNPMPPDTFNKRVDAWHDRTQHTTFIHANYIDMMQQATQGDLIYCDPPYTDTQSILYGAQKFSLQQLFEVIEDCKNRGVYVALSIDGSKKSGKQKTKLNIPTGLFDHEVAVNCGRSMLRRFQMEGQTLEGEIVTDRLLLTY